MNRTSNSPDSVPSSRVFRSQLPQGGLGFRTASWSLPLADSAPLPLRASTTLDALVQSAADPALGIELYALDFFDGVKPKFMSYARVLEQAQRAAAALEAEGVRRGDRVLIVLPTGFEFFVVFFACQWLGATPVPSYPPATMEKIETALDRLVHIANNARARALVTLAELRPLIGDVPLRSASLRRILTDDALMTATGSPPPRAPLTADDTCFIQFTSGSTGTQKGVTLTHRNITSNAHVIGMGLQLTRADRFASWLPLYHDMGLIGGALSPIYWSLPMTLCAPNDFLLKPRIWLEMMSQSKATVSAAPNFAYGHTAKRMAREDLSGLALGHWRIAMSGAEPVNADTVRTFREALAPTGFPPASVFPAYGLAEASLGVTFNTPGVAHRELTVQRADLAQGHIVECAPGAPGSTTLVCVGKPLAQHEVRIFDATGQELGDDTVGHIVVAGPSVMAGYDNNPEATAAVLQDGYLWTGDLGFLRPEGLYIAGRAKDLIIVRGKNYYAEDVETCVEAVEHVRPGGTVAFAVYDEQAARDNVVILAETALFNVDEATQRSLVTSVCEAVLGGTGLSVEEVVLVEPGTLPKTSSGKRQRSLARDRYLSGTLQRERAGTLRLLSVFVRSAVGTLATVTRRLSDLRLPSSER